MAFVVDLRPEKGFCGGQRQRNSSDTFGKFLRSATSRFVETLRHFTKYWHSEKFEVNTECNFVDVRKKSIVDRSRRTKRILFLLFLSRAFLAVEINLLNTFVSRIFGETHDRYVAEFANDFRSIQ